MTSFRPPEDKAWNYVRESPNLTPYLRWVPRGPSLYECTVLPGWPSKVASNQPDGSYATKDLFEPHPSIPRAWRYVARLDDTLALVNGEKFNPVRVEGTIRSNKVVTEAVVFGAGRPNLGLLIVPSPSLEGKSEDEMMEALWPIVEAANESVEGYARIAKSMVKVLPLGTAYPQTDKGSVIRQAFYRRFEDVINKAYDAAEEKSKDAKVMSEDELKTFLKEVVAGVLSGSEVEGDVDFFNLGLDSLRAIQVRSEILKAVDIGDNKLGQTVVFDHPTIDRLAAYLYSLGTGQEVADEAPVETQMQELIDELSSGFTSQRDSASYVRPHTLSIHIYNETNKLGRDWRYWLPRRTHRSRPGLRPNHHQDLLPRARKDPPRRGKASKGKPHRPAPRPHPPPLLSPETRRPSLGPLPP